MKGALNLDKYSPLQDLLPLDDADPELDDEDAAPEQEADQIENSLEEAQIVPTLRLDYKLKTMEERSELVARIIEQTPRANLSNRYLEILGDYIMGAVSKEDKKAHLYLTDNRRITIDRRETSLEGIIEKFENGADGFYNLIAESDKNVIFQHKQEITQHDIDTVPGLKELREAIAQVEEAGKAATGKKKYLLKKQLIEMRRDQYVLKNSHYPTMAIAPCAKGMNKIDLSERRYIDKDGNPQSTGLVSLFNPAHISAILRHYNALKIETEGRHWDDFFYLMEAFDALVDKALQGYPAYRDIIRYKVDGKSNTEIQQMLSDKHNISHSIQYISQLWRTKIPKIIAEQEQHDYLIWYYTHEEPNALKTCSCCGEKKPANAHFFSRDSTSKDGWYSWCKMCRNKRNQTKKIKK